MTKKPALVDKGDEKRWFLAALGNRARRAYLAGGPLLALVVIALFAIGFALSAIAIWFSPAEHSAESRNGVRT